MRKNSPRKWLHACLDLLPVILIPVFMIYSHRHTIDSGSIQVQEQVAINFNQLMPQVSMSGVSSNGVNYSCSNGEWTINGTSSNTTSTINYWQSGYVLTHKYALVVKNFSSDNNFLVIQTMNTWVYDNYALFYPTGTGANVQFALRGNVTYDDTYAPMIYDLTEMGLESATKTELDYYLPQSYYEPVLSQKMLVNKSTLTTYDDTDILSQFTYQLYNSVDKYFNMGNVFNLNGVYDWFNLNIFNGNAPIYIYVVWQIVLYEFVIDLLFLLYGLFMWFIDMVQHLMDKPFKSIK